MSVMVSQITSVSIVYWPVCPGEDQRKYQSHASLALLLLFFHVLTVFFKVFTVIFGVIPVDFMHFIQAHFKTIMLLKFALLACYNHLIAHIFK